MSGRDVLIGGVLGYGASKLIGSARGSPVTDTTFVIERAEVLGHINEEFEFMGVTLPATGAGSGALYSCCITQPIADNAVLFKIGDGRSDKPSTDIPFTIGIILNGARTDLIGPEAGDGSVAAWEYIDTETGHVRWLIGGGFWTGANAGGTGVLHTRATRFDLDLKTGELTYETLPESIATWIDNHIQLGGAAAAKLSGTGPHIRYAQYDRSNDRWEIIAKHGTYYNDTDPGIQYFIFTSDGEVIFRTPPITASVTPPASIGDWPGGLVNARHEPGTEEWNIVWLDGDHPSDPETRCLATSLQTDDNGQSWTYSWDHYVCQWAAQSCQPNGQTRRMWSSSSDTIRGQTDWYPMESLKYKGNIVLKT